MTYFDSVSKWDHKIVSPEDVLSRIKPGMTIFIGSGLAEPRTLVKHLKASSANNIQDIEIIQLVSLGDTVSLNDCDTRRYRLKTFYPGHQASEAITAGLADLIPSRCSRIPSLFQSGAIRIDVAFVQITPPDKSGYASLGVGVDVARYAVEHASLVVGEINEQMPWVMGDTLVHVDDLDCLIHATEPPIYLPRWPVSEPFDKIAANVASTIEDGSCLSFSVGPVYEALGKHLAGKRHLGIHTPFFTDALMDLVDSGVVTNRHKAFYRGKSLAALAIGTSTLMRWLDRNPLVEFQPIDVVMDPKNIGLNERHIAIMTARKIDLAGNVALHLGVGEVTTTPGSIQELFTGTGLSRGGRTIAALPSRSRQGETNIHASLEGMRYPFSSKESLDMVVTEYGTAYMTGRTIRERAQALIDIAHPDDRAMLIEQAKKAGRLYPDQIFHLESGHRFPRDVDCIHTFKEDITVHFRAIKPSDEDNMRKLFYRFSVRAVYSRYHRPIKAMPHERMQEYVNIDYRKTMSIVGLTEESGVERIIAEARYACLDDSPYADTACFVDEAFQGRGIATFILDMLSGVARERGVQGFVADILASNKSMMKVVDKLLPLGVNAVMVDGVYELMIPFDRSNNNKEPGRDSRL